jgi:PadR family transcriptional regulator, regulatory protein AphA
MQKINKTQYAILGMLTMKPMSGYDIKKMTDKSISFFWNENFGHIYPMLKRMEKDGLVTRRSVETAGRPRKNVYAITARGVKELDAWLQDPVSVVPYRHELLLKIFFGSRLKGGELIERVRHERSSNEKLLAEYQEIGRVIDQYDSPDAPYWRMTLRYGMAYSKMAVDWCDETIGEMQRMRNEQNKK